MCQKAAVWTRGGLVLLAVVAVLGSILVMYQPRTQTKAQGTIQTIVLRRGENGYTGSEDTYISKYPPDANYCGAETLLMGYWQQYIGLMRFDVSLLPAHAVVTEAKLQMYAVSWGSDDMTLGAYQVLRDVTMCEADWTQSQEGNAWGLPGANDTMHDRRADPESSFYADSNRKWYELDLTRLVQGWVNGSLENNGVLLLAEPTNASFRFASSYYYRVSERPALVIDYYTDAPPPSSTPPPTGEVIYTLQQGVDGYDGCEDTRISEHNPDQNFANQELVVGDRARVNTLIRFDLSPVPWYATILEATLGLHVANYGQRPSQAAIIATYPVTRTWSETEATWIKATNRDNWALPGCNDLESDRSPVALDSRSLHELGWYTWDVTDAVQRWLRDPASNKGLYLQQTNTEVGGEYDIRESEYPGPAMRPYLIIRCKLIPPTPTPTNSPTVTPTPTRTVTPTPTSTPTVTPTPRPVKLHLPKVRKFYPLECVQWDYSFREEFTDPALTGWLASDGGGRQQVDNGVFHQWNDAESDRFPLLWRNDLFAGAGDDFLFEARFRHTDFTAYGTTIALNSAPFDGTRILAGEGLPPGIEDMLSIHHVVTPGGVTRFDIHMFRDRPDAVVWMGTPGDSGWHEVRITLEKGNRYTMYVDGDRVGTLESEVRPSTVYVGNPTIQPFFGGWTRLAVDYIRISYCAVWGG